MRGMWMGLMMSACLQGTPDDDAPSTLGPRGACDPLAEEACWFPWPSDFYLEDDATTVTGRRVAFVPESLPATDDGNHPTVTHFNKRDGFSINSAVLLDVGPVELTGTADWVDPGLSLDAGSHSVLIDAQTGERVAHWLELDGRTPEGEVPLLVLRPAQALDWNRTYVVAFRGLQRPDGSAVPPWSSYAALVAGEDTLTDDLIRQRPRFEETVWPALAQVGWAPEEPLIAWSFSTASRENTLGRMDTMVEDALQDLPAAGPTFEVTAIEEGDCSTGVVARTIEGTFESPRYTDVDTAGAFLVEDEHGQPVRTGTTTVPFLIRVPCSVAEGRDGSGPVAGQTPVLQYGHGLLGGRDEARAGYLNEMADQFGWVILAIDWTGFASVDALAIVVSLPEDVGRFAFIAERSMQGMVQMVLSGRMAMGGLVNDPALTFDGVKVLDGSSLYYYGNSQGGIMGTAYVGLSPDVDRGVLGVVGGPYSLLLPRSVDFDTYFTLFAGQYSDHRALATFIIGMTQQLWDPVEPGGWMSEIGDGTEKQVLMQVALHDAQVTTIGGHVMARSMGAKQIGTPARDIWGVETSPAAFRGSGLVEWDYTDVPAEPYLAVPPPKEYDTHECPRRMPEAQEQLRIFLETGEVVDTCNGPCTGVLRPSCTSTVGQ